MRQPKIVLVLVCLITFSFASDLYAKWWVFGKSKEGITIDYLYLNNRSYEEGGQKVTFYRDFLMDGLIHIKGRASVAEGRIGAVQISIDGKEKWDKAKLADDGTFVYSFTPELSKTYVVFLKIIDTAGKTNDVDNTRKEVTVSDRNMQALIKELLDNLIRTYKNEDAAGFMSYISDDFQDDCATLDRAIRKDFNLFDSIDLGYSIVNASEDAKGVSVSINFTRSLVSAKSGRSLSDKGTTVFLVGPGEKGLKVLGMKNPLIFGLSDSENVGTGTVAGGGPYIYIDPGTGDITATGAGNTGGPSVGGVPIGIQSPKNLVIQPAPVSMKHHQVGLQWDDCSGASDYIVYEGKNLNGPWTEVDQVSTTSIRFTTDPVAQEATLLYYHVKAVDDKGKMSGPSNVVVWDNR